MHLEPFTLASFFKQKGVCDKSLFSGAIQKNWDRVLTVADILYAPEFEGHDDWKWELIVKCDSHLIKSASVWLLGTSFQRKLHDLFREICDAIHTPDADVVEQYNSFLKEAFCPTDGQKPVSFKDLPENVRQYARLRSDWEYYAATTITSTVLIEKIKTKIKQVE